MLMNAANTIAAHRASIRDMRTQQQIAVNAAEGHRTLSRRATVRGQVAFHDGEAAELVARANRLGLRIRELEAEIERLAAK